MGRTRGDYKKLQFFNTTKPDDHERPMASQLAASNRASWRMSITRGRTMSSSTLARGGRLTASV